MFAIVNSDKKRFLHLALRPNLQFLFSRYLQNAKSANEILKVEIFGKTGEIF